MLDEWDKCLGLVHWDDPVGWVGRVVGGGFRMGNTCAHMADSCQCMAKLIQYCKVKINKWIKLRFRKNSLNALNQKKKKNRILHSGSKSLLRFHPKFSGTLARPSLKFLMGQSLFFSVGMVIQLKETHAILPSYTAQTPQAILSEPLGLACPLCFLVPQEERGQTNKFCPLTSANFYVILFLKLGGQRQVRNLQKKTPRQPHLPSRSLSSEVGI